MFFYEIDLNPSLQDPLDGYVTLGRAVLACGRAVLACGRDNRAIGIRESRT